MPVAAQRLVHKLVKINDGLTISLLLSSNPVFGVSWTKQVPNKAEAPVRFASPEAENKRVILGGDSAIYVLHAEVDDQGVYRCKGDEG